MQAEHTHSPTTQPGVAGRSRNPSPNTHTHTSHPCQEWLDASGARTQPNTPARSGGAQPKPEPKHTHPHRAPVARSGWVEAEHAQSPTPQPGVAGRSRNPSPNTCTHTAHPWLGVAGCKRSTHTAQHPSQEWRGAAETRAQTHTPTPRTRARSGWVQAEHTHSPTPQPGVAGRSRNPSPNTHTHTAHPWPGVAGCKRSTHTAEHPSQEWRGAAETRAQTHTPTPRTRGQEWLGASGAHTQPNTPARSGGAQPKPEPKHTHPHRAPVPGVAGCKRITRKQPNTPARSGGAQPKPEPKHTHPHRAPVARSGWVQAEHTHSPTPQPGVAGRSRNPSPNTCTHTAHPWPGVAGCKRSTHTAQHPSQEWRGAAETRAQTHTPTPRTRGQEWLGGSGARTKPNNPARSGGAQPKPEPKHMHPHRAPVPGVAGWKRSTHKAQHPSQEWRGAAEIRAKTHTPTPRTHARRGWVQGEHTHKHTHSPTPQPGVAGRSRNPNPTTTQTQTQAPRNSRKPSVHSPGTEAARAMQVTRPNEIRRPGLRLHPKACAPLGLEAERATPKHLGTPVPRTCMHAFGTGYARKSGEPLGFRPKEGTCTSTGAHPPGMTSSHAGGDQPSRCCPGPLCWGPPVRSSGK